MHQFRAPEREARMLPWGGYGLAKDEVAMETEQPLLDTLAELSSAADATAIEELRTLLAHDERLRVPAATLATIIAAGQQASAPGYRCGTAAPGCAIR